MRGTPAWASGSRKRALGGLLGGPSVSPSGKCAGRGAGRAASPARPRPRPRAGGCGGSRQGGGSAVTMRVTQRRCFISRKIQMEKQRHKYARPGSRWTERGPGGVSVGALGEGPAGPQGARGPRGWRPGALGGPSQLRAAGGSHGAAALSRHRQTRSLPRRPRKIHGLKTVLVPDQAAGGCPGRGLKAESREGGPGRPCPPQFPLQ